jgi:hypothetical protein
MAREKILKFWISMGRLFAIIGAVAFFYMSFIRNVSPPAAILLLMIAGVLILGIAGVVRWVKTGALK